MVQVVAPVAAEWSGCASVVDGHDDIALLGQVLVPQAFAPGVLYGLSDGLAVYIEKDRIFLSWIEIVGFDDVGRELYAFVDWDLQEFGSLEMNLFHFRFRLRVVFRCMDDSVPG